MASLGREIRKARIDKGLMQKDLAIMLGIPQQYISRIEGDKADVRVSTLERIAKALCVKVSDLFRATEDE